MNPIARLGSLVLLGSLLAAPWVSARKPNVIVVFTDDQGFDVTFGHINGCIDNYSHFVYWNGTNRHDLWDGNKRLRMPGKFFPNLMLERAEQFIAANKDKPFFIYFAANLPHYPYQGDLKWRERYKDLGKQWFLSNTDDDPAEATNRFKTEPELAQELKALLGK